MKIKHVVNVSGGKDSTATLLLALDRLGKDGFEAVFADTQHEHPDTYEYLDYLEGALDIKIRRVTADFTAKLAFKRRNLRKKWKKKSVPAEIISRAKRALVPSGNAFLDLCKLHGGFPSRTVKFCTEDLKIKPIYENVVLPLYQDGYHVIQWLGIRRDESPRRADTGLYFIQHQYGRAEKNSNQLYFNGHRGGKTMRCALFHPIRTWTVADVFRFVESKGLKMNPLYGKGMSRVGCAPCIMARNKENEFLLRDGMIQDRLEFWEAEVHKSSMRGSTRGASFFPIKIIPGALDTYIAGGPPPTVAEVKKHLQRNDPEGQEEMDFDNCEAGYCE